MSAAYGGTPGFRDRAGRARRERFDVTTFPVTVTFVPRVPLAEAVTVRAGSSLAGSAGARGLCHGTDTR
ncbi:hypothetical protein [Streptomyces sp. NBC_01794]|uniref:hypothetical protein n=1 Tax=Streptomyces sp. NBC_01794 TaxID=2975942 RepID=UPI00308B7E2E|nr:hypothetical protein OIE54_17090 [Streptomyces sp. NBC_01794]